MSLWESRILTFVDSCSAGSFETSDDAIWALAAILDEAPPEVAPIVSQRADNDRLAELLDVDAQINAAIELVGPTCGILLTSSPIGSSSGLVKIIDEVEEGNFFASDPAIALLGAYGRALVAILATVRITGGTAL